MGARHRTLIEQSRALIAASRKRIDQTRRRIIFAMQGGSAVVEPPPARRPVVEPASASPRSGEILRIFAGPASGDTPCSACGVVIPKGAPEYELVSSAQTILLDRACFVARENQRHPAR